MGWLVRPFRRRIGSNARGSYRNRQDRYVNRASVFLEATSVLDIHQHLILSWVELWESISDKSICWRFYRDIRCIPKSEPLQEGRYVIRCNDEFSRIDYTR